MICHLSRTNINVLVSEPIPSSSQLFFIRSMLLTFSCIGCSASSSVFAYLLRPSFVTFIAIIYVHLVQHCGGVVCNASSGVSSLFCSRLAFFKVNLVLRTNSYFDLAVAAADDLCIPVRWIGVHKGTHFMLVFSITTFCGYLFQRICHFFILP